MVHGSLFSGIGGFDLAAEWMGWTNAFHCEINPIAQRLLKHYWPDATSYTDITSTDFTTLRGGIDILTGGFPCQPYSLSGNRLGNEDARHLWPAYYRAIKEIQPRVVVGENVRGLINWSGGLVFNEVQSDLEAAGYEVLPCLLPSAGVNAPHERERIWFIAYSNCQRLKERNTSTFTDKSTGQYSKALPTRWIDWPTESPVYFGNDGVSSRVGGVSFERFRNESLKGAGNAIVPQVAFEIFKAIELYELLY